MNTHKTGFSRLKSIANRWANHFKRDENSFLGKVRGVIHVGAHLGEERDLYAEHGLNVLWIEPIPDLFNKLDELIAPYPKQKCIRRLITDEDDKEYDFHISSNEGASSSILDISTHAEIWPEVYYTGSIKIKSATLSTLAKKEDIHLPDYDALIMDTQGSELLVLKGALDILENFRFIKTEIADFESYKDCCRISEMDEFLGSKGFKKITQTPFAHKAGVGSYFEVVYKSDT